MNKEQRAELRKAAEEATPQAIDTAQVIHECDGQYIECPICGGEGSVELEGDYCNFDGHAIGVQFYGIGKAHGAAEAYYRAANPATIMQLLDYIESLERDAARLDWIESVDASEFILSCGKRWYWRAGYGKPHHRVESLRAAIDAAMGESK